MKFNQLERALIVSCTAVFVLAAADALEMAWVCPASGPGSCSDQTTTEERTISAAAGTSAERRPSDNLSGLARLSYCEDYAGDEHPNRLPARVTPAPASQQGVPCPIAADGYVAKTTARLNVSADDEASDSAR